MNNKTTKYAIESEKLYSKLFDDGIVDAEGDDNYGYEPEWGPLSVTTNSVQADIHISLNHMALQS